MNIPGLFGDVYVSAGFIIIVTVLQSVFAYAKGLMTDRAAQMAMMSGATVGIAASPTWMIAFYLFPVMAFIVTKYRFEEKKKLDAQEGVNGERRFMNILGVVVIPLAVQLAYRFSGGDSDILAVAFLSQVAVSTADTVASEIGPMAKKTYMITTMKRIEPGPDGGVSALGSAASTLMALLFQVIGCLLVFDTGNTARIVVQIVQTTVAAVIGNLMDSILGATLESKGRISKYTNNASTALIGAVAGALLFWCFIKMFGV